ncbi:hypothetical protein J2X13_005500 [Aminobacter aminovorans]|nr:hypothetical protein [Aminobacter aminovorans]
MRRTSHGGLSLRDTPLYPILLHAPPPDESYDGEQHNTCAPYAKARVHWRMASCESMYRMHIVTENAQVRSIF